MAAQSDELVFSVTDTGPGMSDAELRGLFTGFAPGQSRDASMGTGLGLFLTAKLVQLLDGRIWARSRSAEGTVMSFAVPREPVPAAAATPPAARALRWQHAGVLGAFVLAAVFSLAFSLWPMTAQGGRSHKQYIAAALAR